VKKVNELASSDDKKDSTFSQSPDQVVFEGESNCSCFGIKIQNSDQKNALPN
jgi:hypothetical protein